VITPAASPPVPPEQMPALDTSWYREANAMVWDTRDHDTEMAVAHGSVPSPAAAVASGVTPASGAGSKG